MTAFAGRALMAAVTLLGVAVVVFFLLRVVPGDPIAMMISPGASEADIAALRAHYGLDASPAVQFWLWVKAMAAGDFGTSISLKRDVLALLGSRLPATLELAFAALIFAVLVGGGVAVAGTLGRGTLIEAAIDGLTGLLLAVPDFIWALALVLVLGVLLAGADTLTGRSASLALVGPDFAHLATGLGLAVFVAALAVFYRLVSRIPA